MISSSFRTRLIVCRHFWKRTPCLHDLEPIRVFLWWSFLSVCLDLSRRTNANKLSDINSNNGGDYNALYWYMVRLNISVNRHPTNYVRTPATSKPNHSVQASTVPTRCTSVEAEPPAPTSTHPSSPTLVLRVMLLPADVELSPEKLPAQTRAWTGLFTGMARILSKS